MLEFRAWPKDSAVPARRSSDERDGHSFSTDETSSTGTSEASEDKLNGTRADHLNGRSQTTISVDGEFSPRLPHERDESPDSVARKPAPTMKTVYADAVSKTVGDRQE
jgi:hypothetical protein